jgi:cation transport ATPase
VSYAVGLTALGSLFLGRAGAHVPHASGHAFMTVAMLLAALALLGAWFAARAVGKARRLVLARLIPLPIFGRGSENR